MNGRQIGNIQALRAVAVLLVVGRHIQVYVERAAGGPPWLGAFRVGDMGVDLFFVISGCVLTLNHGAETFTRGADAARFLYRRAARIYPLYWVYSLPALAVYLWRPGWLHRLGDGMEVRLVPSLLLWPQTGWPLLGQAWSLVYELWFYLVFAGWLFLPLGKRRAGLLAWAGVVTAGGALLAARPALATPEGEVACSMLTLEFIAGMLLGLAAGRIRAASMTVRDGWVLGLGAGWGLFVALPLGVPWNGATRVVEYGLPCAVAVYGALRLENAGWRAPRWLTAIGDWSYSIFLSHIFVIAALAHPLPQAWASNRWREIGLTAGLMGAVLLAGAASHRWLERPLARLTRRKPTASARERETVAVSLTVQA